MKTNIDLLHETYIAPEKKRIEAAVLIGRIINVVIAIAGASTCIYGLVTWINHHNF